MSTSTTKRQSTSKSTKPHGSSRAEFLDIPNTAAKTIYRDFSIYHKKSAPAWHPVKKMRYVFFRMIGGCTITDALGEIHWNAAEFWHLVDLKGTKYDPFRDEYQRAKILQGRAFADSVHTIAEGRDRTTRKSMRRIEMLIREGMRRARKAKNSHIARTVLESLLDRIDINGKGVVSRNKLQIDAAKWIAKSVNPAEYSEKTTLAVGAGEGDLLRPLMIQFVGRDGKVVDL